MTRTCLPNLSTSYLSALTRSLSVPTITSTSALALAITSISSFATSSEPASSHPSMFVMDIGYFSIFLNIFFSLYLLDKETQHDTYLNPCSEFILIFLDSIYSQMTPFCERSFLLELEPLSPDYALFSNHDHGYADLSKCLWLCMSKRVGVFNHLFLYHFLLKYYIKMHKTLEI